MINNIRIFSMSSMVYNKLSISQDKEEFDP